MLLIQATNNRDPIATCKTDPCLCALTSSLGWSREVVLKRIARSLPLINQST
jgi:hypothetical protein